MDYQCYHQLTTNICWTRPTELLMGTNYLPNKHFVKLKLSRENSHLQNFFKSKTSKLNRQKFLRVLRLQITKRISLLAIKKHLKTSLHLFITAQTAYETACSPRGNVSLAGFVLKRVYAKCIK